MDQIISTYNFIIDNLVQTIFPAHLCLFYLSPYSLLAEYGNTVSFLELIFHWFGSSKC
jgi:hypothetical protein